MTENPTLMFDTLHQFIETIEELRALGALTDEDIEHYEIQDARDVLSDLQRWCDAEATASAINYQKWQESRQEIDALRARLERCHNAIALG